MLTKRLSWLLLVLVQFGFAHAQTVFTSTGNGNWTAAFSSSGSGPTVIYEINAGDTVTVNTTSTSLIDTIRVYGTLDFINGRKIDMKGSGTVVIESGGSVTGGSGGSGFRYTGGSPTSGPFSNNGVSYSDSSTGRFVNGSPLPVSWLDMNLTQNYEWVDLEWSTASELNNSYFVIEYGTSPEELDSIGMLYSMASAGFSMSILRYNYSFRLPEHKAQSQQYIRVTQVDFDGNRSSSKTMILNTQQNDLIHTFSSNYKIHVQSELAGEMEVLVYSSAGHLIKKASTYHNQVSLSVAETGVYFVHVLCMNTVKVEKVYIRP